MFRLAPKVAPVFLALEMSLQKKNRPIITKLARSSFSRFLPRDANDTMLSKIVFSTLDCSALRYAFRAFLYTSRHRQPSHRQWLTSCGNYIRRQAAFGSQGNPVHIEFSPNAYSRRVILLLYNISEPSFFTLGPTAI